MVLWPYLRFCGILLSIEARHCFLKCNAGHSEAFFRALSCISLPSQSFPVLNWSDFFFFSFFKGGDLDFRNLGRWNVWETTGRFQKVESGCGLEIWPQCLVVPDSVVWSCVPTIHLSFSPFFWGVFGRCVNFESHPSMVQCKWWTFCLIFWMICSFPNDNSRARLFFSSSPWWPWLLLSSVLSIQYFTKDIDS